MERSYQYMTGSTLFFINFF